MERGPSARRGHVNLAYISLGIGDELGNGLGRNRWGNHHDQGFPRDARDRRDVTDEIKIELVECRISCVRCIDEEQSVAIRRCTHDNLGGDIGASTWQMLRDEYLGLSVC